MIITDVHILQAIEENPSNDINANKMLRVNKIEMIRN